MRTEDAKVLRGVLCLLTGAAALACAPGVSAQLGDLLHGSGEIGVGGWAGRLALSGSLGAGLHGRWGGLTLSPAAVLVQSSDGDRRYVQIRRGGETVCADGEGFAQYPDQFCPILNSTVTWTPNAEVHFSAESLGLPLWLGVGARAGTARPWTLSLGYVDDLDEHKRIRLRLLYSEDAWHLGLGVAARL